MRLGICSNFANGVGGSEIVIHHIAKRLVKNYNYEVLVFAFNIDKEVVYEGVKYIKWQKSFYFFKQLKESNLDHLFIYSDSFWGFKDIISEVGMGALCNTRLSVALLGMNAMSQNEVLYKRFKEVHRKFRVITHSSFYDDYKKCQEDGIPVTVIPNGVEISEFSGGTITNKVFREKYDIKSKYILLSVGNFFFGKGQEYLPDICNKLACPKFDMVDVSGKNYPKHLGGYDQNDFCLVSISHSIKYPHEKTFLNKFKEKLKAQKYSFEYKILRDIPREDVVAAFKAAYIFLFTSLKEVFPLVILEAMASSTPWVSMNVGSLEEFRGGLDGGYSPGCLVYNSDHDSKGYKTITPEIIDEYAKDIDWLLREYDGRIDMAGVGDDMVESKYNWDKIVELYHNVFI